MKHEYDERLHVLLPEIEEALVSATPRAVREMKVSEPAYAIFLWYDDSANVGDFVPDFGIGTESLRSACFNLYRGDRDSMNDCIWRPHQVIHEKLLCGKFRDPELVAKCNAAFSLMFAADKLERGLETEEEGELLRPFRSMMHRVGSRLNQYPWEGIVATTDDFVVVSGNRTGYWSEEDLTSSVPKSRLRLLAQRGLF